jgi:penicillin-binding protein 2
MALIDLPSKTRIERSPSGTTRTVGKRNQSLFMMGLISFLMLMGIGGRFAFLQLVKGKINRELADENRIRLIARQAERGRILDRNGRILAISRPSYSVFVYPIGVNETQWISTRQRLARILSVSEADIQKRLEQSEQGSPYLIRIAQGLSPAQVTAIVEYKSELPGIEVDIESVRNYPNGDLAAHVLGYTREITDEALQQCNLWCFQRYTVYL